MILHDYLRVLRRGWWVVVLLTLLGAGAAIAASFATTPAYYARATVVVATVGDASPGDLQQGNVFAMQRTPTYADLATTATVLDRAAATLGAGTDTEDLRRSVTSVARPETAIIDIEASGSDAALVAERANAVAEALTVEAQVLDAPGVASPVQLTVVEPAAQPEVATTPRPRNNLLIGIVVGLVLGLAIVVVADALDTRIRTFADLPRSPALATLTSIPTGRARRARGVSASDARVESFRNLRANLQFGTQARGVIAVAGVTSASDAQGVARQLAAALGEIGSTVVIADVDLRSSGSRHRDRKNDATELRPGVADVLNGTSSVDEVISVASADHVYELTTGTVDPSSAQRLSTSAMRDMLDDLSARFDYVILSCPPLVERSESAVAAALAGNSLVVVESGATKRSEFLFALELLAGVRVTSISVALDHVRDLDLGGTSGQTVLAGQTAT
ncbi:Lipopolysaccharide biosynthesis protein [Modestobacter italicus]|uniref:Lipopolysaccharide biosynthesis protein n=1 Tax=Modestobacter italicus (strain DSM 44449 / CECT 9708 / BC 501) TaxID=2732864 RepID=I4ERC5_MODI5|nr:polysaccharide biosynthesis tyrosine autokinase [Modestobacter marinus]CCH85938.1 Lipopolysaccharide biosynthesis protein [Modestobacter marinus]